MNIYNVYWAIKGVDCEKNDTYVFANTARDAMRLPIFKNVLVLEVRPVYGEEEKRARKYGWCENQ